MLKFRCQLIISYYRLLLFTIVMQYFFALFHPQPKIRSYKPYKLLLHKSCKLNYYHPICSIIAVNRTVVGNVQSILQSETNRCNSANTFIKKVCSQISGPSFFGGEFIFTADFVYIQQVMYNYCKTIFCANIAKTSILLFACSLLCSLN